jgi:hypothetical protein
MFSLRVAIPAYKVRESFYLRFKAATVLAVELEALSGGGEGDEGWVVAEELLLGASVGVGGRNFCLSVFNGRGHVCVYKRNINFIFNLRLNHLLINS